MPTGSSTSCVGGGGGTDAVGKAALLEKPEIVGSSPLWHSGFKETYISSVTDR